MFDKIWSIRVAELSVQRVGLVTSWSRPNENNRSIYSLHLKFELYWRASRLKSPRIMRLLRSDTLVKTLEKSSLNSLYNSKGERVG